MSLPWVPLQTSAVRAELSRIRWTKDNPAPVFVAWADVLVMASDGDLRCWSVRQLADRWGWSRGRVRRQLMQAWADHKRTTDGPAADHLRTTIAARFSWVAEQDGPPADHRRTTDGPSRARSLVEEEEDQEEEHTSPSNGDTSSGCTPEPKTEPAPDPLAEQWSALVSVYARSPGRWKLTPSRRAALRKRVSEAGDDWPTLLEWLRDSQHHRAVYLRERGSASITTALRAGKAAEYLALALEEHDAGPSPRTQPQQPVSAFWAEINRIAAGGDDEQPPLQVLPGGRER